MSHIKIELRKEDVDFIKGVCSTFNNDPQELINVLHTHYFDKKKKIIIKK